MFDFIRKDALFDALDNDWPAELKALRPFHLKTIQDCAVYAHLKDCRDMDIAEAGGGDSRLLRALARNNRCVNIDPFQGEDGGPSREISIRGVHNVRAALGDFNAALEDESFDIVFSISVIEHVPLPALERFFKDGLRILRPGGLWLHAIDAYIGNRVEDSDLKRFSLYREWAEKSGATEPVGAVFKGPPVFSTDMASNPDDVMHSWGRVAPKLIERRKKLQSVSLIVAARKV